MCRLCQHTLPCLIQERLMQDAADEWPLAAEPCNDRLCAACFICHNNTRQSFIVLMLRLGD